MSYGIKGLGNLSSLIFLIHVLLSRSAATDLALLRSTVDLSWTDVLKDHGVPAFKVLYGVHTFSFKNWVSFHLALHTRVSAVTIFSYQSREKISSTNT
jgi:hypothetical protein